MKERNTQTIENEKLFNAIECEDLNAAKEALGNGADVNYKDNEGNTALLKASFLGNIELVKLLVKNGADIDIKGREEDTPLITSFKWSEERNIDIVKLLLQNGADVNGIDSNGNSLMFFTFPCYEKEDIECLKLVVKYGGDVNAIDSFGDTPLLQICKDFYEKYYSDTEEYHRNNRDTIALLLENGADVNKKDSTGNTGLIYLCDSIASHENLDIVKLLLAYGADINAIDSNGYTALMLACIRNNIELVELLLKYEVDIDAIDSNGHTALMLACMKNTVEIVILLIDNKADINLKSFNNFNALSYGNHNKEIRKILYRNGIDKRVEIVFKEMRLSKWLELYHMPKLHESYRELEIKDLQNDLKYRIWEDNEKFKSLKLKTEEEVKSILNEEYSTEHINIIDLIKENYPSFMIEFVVAKCKDINIRDQDGNTALMVASKMNRLDIVNILLKYHPNPNVKNKNNEESWELSDNTEIINKLLEFQDEYNLTNQPEKLVKLLTNFTIDTPIKYTTHEWRNRIDDKYFDDFDLFLQDIGEQFKNLGSELETLSPNLYRKVEAFIVSSKNPNSWQSMKDLKPWVEEKKEPLNFHIANENILFREIIESFKNDIEMRENMLQEIFLEHKKRLGRKFKITISDNLKGEKFYTDVETFKNAVDEIFREIEKYAKEQNEYEIEVELFKPENNFIELHIIHINSTSTREAQELLERIKQEKGDSVLRRYFKNLCDWEIKASHKNNNFTIDCFNEEIKNIEKAKGFTHIMRFYK